MLCFIFGAFRTVRTIAQFGSALDWGSRGRGFKSRWSDQESPSFRRLRGIGTTGFSVLQGRSGAMYYRPPPRGMRYGRAPVPPHARVPSPLGRDVPGGWHGRPYRPMAHSPGDALRHPVRARFSSKADAPEKPKSGSGVGANLEMVESGIPTSPFVLDGPHDLFHQSPQAWLLFRASGYEEDLPDGHPAPIAVLQVCIGDGSVPGEAF